MRLPSGEKAGQLLIRLDDRDVRAAVDHAEAVLKQHEAMLASLHAKYVLQQSMIEQASADVLWQPEHLCTPYRRSRLRSCARPQFITH